MHIHKEYTYIKHACLIQYVCIFRTTLLYFKYLLQAVFTKVELNHLSLDTQTQY